MWIFEVLVANVWGPQGGGLQGILYFGATFTAYLLPGLAGLLAGRRAGQIGSGLQAGLLTGMLGGLILFVAVLGPLAGLLGNAG